MLYFLFFCIPVCIGVGGIIFLIKELATILNKSSTPSIIEITPIDAATPVHKESIHDIPIISTDRQGNDSLVPTLSTNDDSISVGTRSDVTIERILKSDKIEKIVFQRLFIDKNGNNVDIMEIFSRIRNQRTNKDTMKDAPMKQEINKLLSDYDYLKLISDNEYLKHSSGNEVITNGTESSN